MKRFLKRHKDRIVGTLTGFDRILLKGTLRSISHCAGLEIFLSSQKVLWKEFADFAEQISREIAVHAEVFATQQGRPYQYLNSAAVSKEQLALELIERDQLQQGLVCVLAAVEPCQTITVRGNRQTKRLELRVEQRHCKHLYYYFLDREFGLLHIRLQSWFPFTLEVGLNGRRWLAKQLQRAGVSFVQQGNTFTELGDRVLAQRLMDQLSSRKFSKFLNSLCKPVNPLTRHPEWKLRPHYWSFRQVEIATDVMFREADSLATLYPHLLQHAMLVCHSEDVLRFLGRRVSSTFNGEINSNLKRYEGLRIKHWVEENSLKMYDKAPTVLRIETTINNPHRFKVWRKTTLHGRVQMGWLRLRKGVVDIARLVRIARAANERYLQALAVVGNPSPSARLFDPVSRPVIAQGRRYRALQPVAPSDNQLFALICQGQFLIYGFRIKDLCRAWATAVSDQRYLTRQLGRKLRLLRAHDLIFKVPKTHYYRITQKGHALMATAIKFRAADIALLAA